MNPPPSEPPVRAGAGGRAAAGDPVKRGAKVYLVKWEGYPESEASWEPCKHLSSALLAEARLLEVQDQEMPEPQRPNAEKRARAPAASPSSKLTPDAKR